MCSLCSTRCHMRVGPMVVSAASQALHIPGHTTVLAQGRHGTATGGSLVAEDRPGGPLERIAIRPEGRFFSASPSMARAVEAEAAAADPGSASAFMSLAWMLAPTVAPVAPVAHCSARCPLLRLPHPRSHYPVSLTPVSRIPYPSIPYPAGYPFIPYPVIPCPGPTTHMLQPTFVLSR